MVKIRVLGFVLPLIRHMNEGIEARTIQITSHERLKLFLVELDYFPDCFTQSVQQFPGMLTIYQARHGLLSSPLNTSCPVISNSSSNITLSNFPPVRALEFILPGMFQKITIRSGSSALSIPF
jgi:hypothetical protein